MKESKFIHQNKKKWREFEQISKTNAKDPEKLSELFIEVTNDLSYARSNYPHRSIKVYLNNLANGVFTRLYKNRFGARRNIRRFWTDSLPKVMYESRKALLFAFILFASASMIGVFSSVKDPGFARTMLGDQYIDMTESFIEEGDPMKVYKQMDEVEMFSLIALNNLIVAFRVFIMGIFFAIGTVGSLIFEGIRLGSFQYFFVERGLFQESFLTIWMHGAPEISCIILAGAAGMTLGGGLIFPGTYSRGQALLQGARRGVMIMLGVIPILIFAALIEGFVTRMTEVPDLIRATIIALNFGLITYYFAIYPYRRFHKQSNYKPFEDKIPDSTTEQLKLNVIRSSGEIYTEVFRMFGKNFLSFFKWSIVIGTGYLLSIVNFIKTPITSILEGNSSLYRDIFVEAFLPFTKIRAIFNYSETPMLYAINSLFIAIIGTIVFYHIKTHFNTVQVKHNLGEFLLRNLHKVAIFSYAYQLIFFVNSSFGFLSLVVLLPAMILFAFISVYENCNPLFAITRGMRYIGAGIGNIFGYSTMLLLINIIVIQFINIGMVEYLFDTLLSGFQMEDETYFDLMNGMTFLTTFVTIGTFISTLMYAAGLYYFSVREKLNATSLLKNIEGLGENKRAYGLPTEN